MIWGGDEMFETNIIKKLKHTFQFGCEEIEAFTYTAKEFIHDSDFSISMNQNNYISSITEKVLPIKRIKDKISPISNEQKQLYRRVVGQLN